MENCTTRACSKCGVEKPYNADHFYLQKSSRGTRLLGFCRECRRKSEKEYRERTKEIRKIKSKARYEANKEQILKDQREYYVRANRREASKPAAKAWRARNKEKIREKNKRDNVKLRDKLWEIQKAWRARNPERVKEINRRHYQKHREKYIIRAENKRAAMLKRGFFSEAEWRAKFAQYEYRCHWCGKHCRDDAHRDHLIPFARGGMNVISNIVPSCSFCNQSRGKKLPHEWNTNRAPRLL